MPVKRIVSTLDPLVRLLLLAIVLASFVPVGEDGYEVARVVSNGGIFVLFLLNGLRLPRAEVREGLLKGRFLLPLAAWCFIAMGAAGLALSHISDGWLPAEMALGLLFLGLLPSTVQSATAYSSLAGGNVAASVVAAAVLNILGVFITAPLLALLAGTQSVDLDLDALRRIVMILILPFVIGQILQDRLGHYVQERKALVSWLDRGVIAMTVYIAFSSAVTQGLWTSMAPQVWGAMLVLIGALLVFGFLGSWLLGGLVGLDRGTRIAFLFAGAQKSIAIGAPLAAVLFPPAVAGLLLVPVLIYHLAQMIVSARIAAVLNPPEITRPAS